MAVGDASIGAVSGFFDQAFILFIDNQVVPSPTSTYTAATTPYFVCDTQLPANNSINGIQVNWLHMFFETHFVRVIYTFTNTYSFPVTFNADIQSNLATNANTAGM